MVPALATRLAGSSDLYQGSGRAPYHSINFVTCHDGFTLADLVSYNHKHNQSNGENNCDGTNDNLSWNCGIEGPSSDREVDSLRMRQVKSFAALLLLSHGVPMMLYGDEVGRSQKGNNNAYCHDELSRMDWDQVRTNHLLLTFFQRLIRFRKKHNCLRRGSFVPVPGRSSIHMDWHGTSLGAPDWSWNSRSLALHIVEIEAEAIADSVYLISNAHDQALRFELPQISRQSWVRFLDTSLPAGLDITEPGSELELESQGHYVAGGRSTVVLVGRSSQ